MEPTNFAPSRRQVLKMGAAAGLSLGALPFGRAAAFAAQGRLRLGYTRFWTEPPIFVGMKKGWFDTPDLKTEFTHIPASMRQIEAIVAGDLDAGIVSGSAVMIAAERGLKVKGIIDHNSYKYNDGLPVAWVVPANSPIKTVKDLKGKQIAISSYGSGLDIRSRKLLLDHGIDPKTQAELLEIPMPKAVTSILTGRLDASCFPPSFYWDLPKEKIRILENMWYRAESRAHRVPNFFIVMAEEYITKHRDTAVAFAKQFLKAANFCNDNPEEADSIWSEWAKGKRTVKILYIPRDGRIDAEGAQEEADMMLSFGYMQRRVDLRKEALDYSIIDAALKA